MTKGLVALVESKTAITDLIGTSPTRFYPRKLPQGMTTFPAATFRIVNIDDTSDFDGASDYDFAFIDIHSYGRSYSDARDLNDTIRTQIVDSVGTFNTIQIDHVWFMPSGMEDWLEDLEIWTIQSEYKIAYRR